MKDILFCNVKCWADVLEPDKKDVIRSVLASTPDEKRCPHLGMIVENKEAEWVYCGVDRKKHAESGFGKESPKPALSDPRYHAMVDYCFCSCSAQVISRDV